MGPVQGTLLAATTRSRHATATDALRDRGRGAGAANLCAFAVGEATLLRSPATEFAAFSFEAILVGLGPRRRTQVAGERAFRRGHALRASREAGLAVGLAGSVGAGGRRGFVRRTGGRRAVGTGFAGRCAATATAGARCLSRCFCVSACDGQAQADGGEDQVWTCHVRDLADAGRVVTPRDRPSAVRINSDRAVTSPCLDSPQLDNRTRRGWATVR